MVQLKKELGFSILLLFAVNSIIGTGAFFIPAAAASMAGPASIISWLIAAFVAILISLAFAELSSMFPSAGGIYEYVKISFGTLPAFIMGWISWIVSNVSIALLVIGGMTYLKDILSLSNTTSFIFSLAFIILINYISYRGINFSAGFLLFFSILTVISLLAITFIGSFSINLSNLTPFFVGPKLAIFSAVFLISETFFGWEAVSFLSEEAKRPEKVIPKVMILGSICVAILVISAVFVAIASIGPDKLASSQLSILEVVKENSSPKVFQAITLIAILNILGASAAWIISTPRLVFAMARDKSLPHFLSRIHSKNATPYYAIIFQTIITSFIILSNSFILLMETLMPLAIIMYCVVLLCVPRLRKTLRNKKRHFKMPFGEVLPYILVFSLLIIMAIGFSFKGVVLGASLLLMGIPLYFIAIAGYNKNFVRFISNLTGELTYYSYKYIFGKYTINHLIDFFSDTLVSKVADLGCGIGYVTHQLAKRAIPLDGKMFGIDFAKRGLDLAKKHQKQRDVRNLEYLHSDLFKLSKKNASKLKNLDGITGIGVLENVHDPKRLLKIYSKCLRQGGKFYFIDYDFIGPVFDKPWVEKNNEILALFRSAGLKVRIFRERRLLWHYVHMYGTKE